MELKNQIHIKPTFKSIVPTISATIPPTLRYLPDKASIPEEMDEDSKNEVNLLNQQIVQQLNNSDSAFSLGFLYVLCNLFVFKYEFVQFVVYRWY